MFLKSDLANKTRNYFLFLIIFVLHFLILNKNYEIPLLGNLYADLRVNVEGAQKEVFINNKNAEELQNFPFTSYSVFGADNQKISSLSIYGDKAVISLDNKLFYVKNPKGEFQNKYLKNASNISDKGILKIFQFYFLSLFYNTKIFMLLFFAVAFLFMKSPPRNLIYWIMGLALILRCADLNCGFWTDEYYSVYYAGNSKLSFLTTFQDAGNPPLFFIMIWLLEKFAGYNQVILRLIPVAFSVAAVYLIYLFVKKYAGYKPAIFSAFLFTINIYSIISAQELRAYSALIFLSVCISYILFNLIEKNENKKFIIYGILSVLILNLHYFGAIILFSNFIFGLIFIKKRLKFIAANLLSGVSFLPYFLMTGLNKGLLDENFNSRISMPDLNCYIDIFVKFSQSKVAALIILLIGMIVLFRKNKFYSYSFYVIFSVFISSYLFCYIKPIAQDYYYICLLPFFIILISYILFIPKKWLQIFIMFVFLTSYFGFKDYIKRDRNQFSNFGNLILYAINDAENNFDTVVILPYSKEVMQNVYDMKGIEIVEFPLTYSEDMLIDYIDKLDKNRIYFKLEYKMANEFLKKASLKYDVSYIRGNKDVMMARIIKNKGETIE